MQWTDQAQELARAWTEAQQKMAAGWTEAAQRMKVPGGGANADWVGPWYDAAAKAFEGWLGGAEGVPGAVAQRLFGGARAYHSFVEFMTDAMRHTSPQVEQGTNWAEALKQYLATAQESMNARPDVWMRPEAAAAVAADSAQLWKLYLQEAKAMSAPWFESLREARGHVGEAMAGDHRAIIRAADLFTDTFESTAGKLLGAPAIGYSREYQEKLVKAFDTWVEVRKAEAAFNTELVNIGFKAMQALAEAVQEKAKEGEKIESAQELFNLWVLVAEKTYAQAAKSETFVESQANLVNAAMHHRVHERTLMEVYQNSLQLPTRRELDDAYKHMHQLRAQVKQLTKQVNLLEGALEQAVASLQQQQDEKAGLEDLLASKLAALEKRLGKDVAALEKQLDRKVTAVEEKLAKPAITAAKRKPPVAKKATAGKPATTSAKRTRAKEV